MRLALLSLEERKHFMPNRGTHPPCNSVSFGTIAFDTSISVHGCSRQE